MRNLILATILTGFAATGSIAADRNAIPNATPTGPAISCVQSSSIRETRVHGDSTIDFVMNGGKVYRNTLPNSCPGLGFNETILYKTQTNQLCSVDIITVLQSPGLMRGASCGLGKFQPVELEKKQRR
ncbi:MAG: hypothetical protein JWO15_2618 [Sphingomonadales bacterium]|nr:hypothetical protein [Sphingomonadales bacterium]